MSEPGFCKGAEHESAVELETSIRDVTLITSSGDFAHGASGVSFANLVRELSDECRWCDHERKVVPLSRNENVGAHLSFRRSMGHGECCWFPW
jgi:hypothetical protein